jgi:hypothetical protein
MNETLNTTNNQEAPSPLQSEAFFQPRYKGVGGWLLLFCIVLTALSPLSMMKSLFDKNSGLTPEDLQYFDRYPTPRSLEAIGQLLGIGITAFSVYAGIGLWRIRPGAVRTAKLYLLCLLGVKIIGVILGFMVTVVIYKIELNYKEKYGGVTILVGSLLNFTVWYSYLSRSKRVKATYE